MRSFVMIIIFLLSLLSAPAFAEVPVKDYQKFKNSESMQMYVAGVGVGFSWANIFMIDETGKVLYCQPSKLALGTDNYIRILEDEIKRYEATAGFQKAQETPIEIILLNGLRKTFPCVK
jgi:hypothetical protein